MKRLLALPCLLLLCLLPLPVRAALPDPVRFSAVLELGNVEQARAWLDEGLDPNFEGGTIGTGLMIGAWEGNIALMELFLARGADIDAANRFGEQALMLAAWKGRREAVQWLLDRGAKPNRAQDKEWSALHYAVFAGQAELTERLLAAGADVNARSTNGSTVVMMAAREGHAELAQRLLAAGANPAIRNDFDDDAVAWAMRQGHYRIAQGFTDAANFAELARRAAQLRERPLRSVPVPDAVEEHLRMARLAESKGRRGDALDAYRKALAVLRTQQAPQKVGAGETVKAAQAPAEAKAPSALVIRARRGQPERQGMAFTYEGEDEAGIDRLLAQARAAEAAGRTTEAVRLFRAASARIRAGK
jgi:ankyrin repeat protein